MAEDQFKISVVIPVYNVELYVAETIESVIGQDMGFEDNIQIILVNDGSTDESEKICLDYQKRYPDNIEYVYQENAGVSTARNRGMDYVKGKYVNFLDSDDKWSPDAFSKVYQFFEEHEKEVNLVSCKQEFFEAKSGPHKLSRGRKFERSRIINILDDYQYTQFHITASFVKKEAMRLAMFDPNMKYGEDAVYVSELILDKHKYGVVAEPIHYYRKRANNSSTIQGKEKALDWYKITPKRFYEKLMDISLQKWGCVIPYVQYATCYDIQWRVNDRIHLVLSQEEREVYVQELQGLLLRCDDDIIIKQRDINLKKKLFLLSLKYGKDVSNQIVYCNGNLMFKNIPVINLQKHKLFRIDVLELKGDLLCLSGKMDFIFVDRLEFFLEDDQGKKYPVKLEKLNGAEDKIWNENISDIYFYNIQIDISQVKKLKIGATYMRCYPFVPQIAFGKFSKLYNGNLENDYCATGKYLITRSSNEIYVATYTKKLEKDMEKKFQNEILSLEAIDMEEKKEVLWYRKRYFAVKVFHRKKIWLISDRINVAGDNGEAFFRYISKCKPKDIEAYFVISKESKDYERIKCIGKVIPYGTTKCKLYTMLADKIISSQAENNICNPFYGLKRFVGNLFHYDFVFLQHGIIKDDLSAWLNKSNKNISMFVTSAKPEYESVLSCPYMYGTDVVKLTGLPRYDNVVQDVPCEKRIIFMPTWRTELAIEMDPVTGIRPYNPAFVESEYYQFYNRLINDERIKTVLKENGYKGKFCVHANNIANVSDFHENEVIEVSPDIVDYQKEFKESALLITDYSSVAFDFAYLKKPVIYAQADFESFFEGAVYDKGYWDYDEMGFGPVCYDYESTVRAIIEMIENDCQLREEYLRRVEQFYFKFDQNNCERVYQAIREIRG